MGIAAAICAFRGHDLTPVREAGLAPRPGGILPSLDGYITYAPDPTGEHRACKRCRGVFPATPKETR